MIRVTVRVKELESEPPVVPEDVEETRVEARCFWCGVRAPCFFPHTPDEERLLEQEGWFTGVLEWIPSVHGSTFEGWIQTHQAHIVRILDSDKLHLRIYGCPSDAKEQGLLKGKYARNKVRGIDQWVDENPTEYL